MGNSRGISRHGGFEIEWCRVYGEVGSGEETVVVPLHIYSVSDGNGGYHGRVESMWKLGPRDVLAKLRLYPVLV